MNMETIGLRKIYKMIPELSMKRELILKHVLTCARALSCEPLPKEFATKVRTTVAMPSAGINVNCMHRISIVPAASASSP